MAAITPNHRVNSISLQRYTSSIATAMGFAPAHRKSAPAEKAIPDNGRFSSRSDCRRSWLAYPRRIIAVKSCHAGCRQWCLRSAHRSIKPGTKDAGAGCAHSIPARDHPVTHVSHRTTSGARADCVAFSLRRGTAWRHLQRRPEQGFVLLIPRLTLYLITEYLYPPRTQLLEKGKCLPLPSTRERRTKVRGQAS